MHWQINNKNKMIILNSFNTFSTCTKAPYGNERDRITFYNSLNGKFSLNKTCYSNKNDLKVLIFLKTR